MTLRRSSALCAAIALIGVAVPVHAWRTAADLPEVRGARFVGWRTTVISVELYAEGAPVPPRELETAIGHALSQWTNLRCADLTLLYGGVASAAPSPHDGRNTIAWIGREWSARGYPAGAAGITDVEYAMTDDGTWSIREADVYLNSEFIWSGMSASADPRGRDVASVLTHELGHLLGLLHPCELDAGSPACAPGSLHRSETMYPEYTGPTQGTLDLDDVEALCSIYATEAASCTPECVDGSVCSDGRCLSRCGGELCSPGDVCVGELCRPASLVCEVAADCSPGLLCLGGLCRRSGLAGPDGTACDLDADCVSGACSLERYCAPPCTEACVCDAAADLCEVAGAFGRLCERGEDCTTGLCLIDTPSSHCTSECASTACPRGYSCAAVDSLSVCRRTPTPAPGCSVTGPPRPASEQCSIFAVFLFICTLAYARTRSKRP